MSATEFHALPVAEVVTETEDTVTVRFAVPSELGDTFTYAAGQYLTLRFVIDGQDVRRAYSMSSAPHENHLAVSVKRVEGGLVSNHIADHLAAGQTVDVMPPQGRFLLEPDPDRRNDYYLFGAGSGITPLMSILKTVLEKEPKSKVHLLYGSRNEEQIIFKAELDRLEAHYRDQLSVRHTLSRPKREKSGGLSGFFSRGKVSWTGEQGRIDAKKIETFLGEYPTQGQTAHYFICGPGNLIDRTEETLQAQGIAADHIHTERFVSAHDAQAKASKSENAAGATVQAKLNGKLVTVELKAGQSILDGLLEAKVDPPYSCLAGACSTCAAKVLKGGVRMDVCYALDQDEVDEGMVLTCQSHPTTEEVEIDFEV